MTARKKQDWKEFNIMARKVLKISPRAYAFLIFRAPALANAACCGSLLGSFVWEKTPQGHNFWSDISYQI